MTDAFPTDASDDGDRVSVDGDWASVDGDWVSVDSDRVSVDLTGRPREERRGPRRSKPSEGE